jgi:hypothetical protein
MSRNFPAIISWGEAMSTDEITALYRERFGGPFPYSDCRFVYEQMKRKPYLIPELDFYRAKLRDSRPELTGAGGH